MTPLLLFALLGQTSDLPPIPAGCSPEFKATAYRVESLLSEGKFDEAATIAAKLPRKSIKIEWDDRAVPEKLRPLYLDARDDAVLEWKRLHPDLQVTFGDRADIRISFQEVLPPPADSVMPAGATFFTSDAKDEPRIEAVIALKRDTPPMSIDPRHVENEVGYAIGSFLGIASFPRPIGFMGRSDLLVRLELHASKFELEESRATIALSDALRTAAAKKVKVEVEKPEMYVNPSKLGHDPVSQGDPVTMSLEITNRGKAPLKLWSLVNCSCVQVQVPDTVLPGQTGLAQVSVDTSRVNGFVDKNFVIYSNDPDNPEKRIVVDFWVKPGVRLLRPNGGSTVVVPRDGLKEEMYLVYDPAKPIKVKDIKVNGIKGIVEFTEWKGKLADPELNQPETDRVGYKLSVLLSPTEKRGRIPVSFAIFTENPDSVIYESCYLQWGIASLPDRVYFGDVKPTGAVAYFILSRPGKPFKIKGVRSSNPLLQTAVETMKNGEYRVTVSLLGNLPAGKMQANIIVDTDDPDQPNVVVPVDAFVK